VALIITIALNRTRAHEASATASQHLSAPTAAISQHAAVIGYHDAYLAVFALMLVPFVISFFINDEKAAESLRNRMAVPIAAEPQASLKAPAASPARYPPASARDHPRARSAPRSD